MGRFWLWVEQILNHLNIRMFIIFDSRHHRHLGEVMAIDGMLFLMLKNDLRQRLEIDYFKEVDSL